MSIEMIKDIIIYKDRNYNSFPNIIRRPDDALMVGFRQAPDYRKKIKGRAVEEDYDYTHVDASSKAVFTLSRDEGKSWSEVADIYDHYVYGVQDPCLNMLEDTSVMGSFFTWKVFAKEDMPVLHPLDRETGNGKYLYRPDDAYTIRSADGELWDDPVAIDFPSKSDYKSIHVRGNSVSMSDGSLVLAVYGPRTSGVSTVTVLKSKDKGKSFEELSTLPTLEGYDFYEPNLYRTAAGKLVCFLRTHRTNQSPYTAKNNGASPLVICSSLDGGKSWSAPQIGEFYSPSPFHPLRLSSGNVLLTYGYRHKPYGLRAILLDGECSNVSTATEYILRDDGLGGDIGYTSSILLRNGDILITYYYYGLDGYRYIAGTICREI